MPIWTRFDGNQAELFERSAYLSARVSSHGARSYIGYFYERATADLFGGEICPTLNIGVQPDVVVYRDEGPDLLFDSKVSGTASRVKLWLDQVEAYGRIGPEDFPFDGAEVYLVFWIHTARGFTVGRPKIVDVINATLSELVGAAIIPLSVVRRIVGFCPATVWKASFVYPRSSEDVALLPATRVRDWIVGEGIDGIHRYADERGVYYPVNGHRASFGRVALGEVEGLPFPEVPLMVVHDGDGVDLERIVAEDGKVSVNE